MLINFWNCKYSEVEEQNSGTNANPDYDWVYFCNHPKNSDGLCGVDNKWCGDEDNCKLIEISEILYGRPLILI